MGNFAKNLRDRCLAEGRDRLLREWHPTKNLPLTPDKVSSGSKTRVWWLCEECGHEWPAVVRYRFGYGKHKPSGCPECARRPKVTLREWCIANGREDLLAQFDAEKSGFTPDDVSAHSSKPAHWSHFDAESSMAHEWPAIVAARTKPGGTGCPYCARVGTLTGYNDLATRRPDLMAYWDYGRNSVDPAKIPMGYASKAFWACPACGDRWESTPMAVAVRDLPCRQCEAEARRAKRRHVVRGVNDLATTHPSAVALWHPTYNGSLTPQDVTAGDDRLVWWCSRSSQTGRWIEWEDPVSYRARHLPDGGPDLFIHLREGVNDLATTHPFLAMEWSSRNDEAASRIKATGKHRGLWNCSCCGCEWELTTIARTHGSLCPECASLISAGAASTYRAIVSQLDASLTPTPFGPGVRARLPYDPFDPSTYDPNRRVVHLAVTTLFEGWELLSAEAASADPDRLLVVEAVEASVPLVGRKFGVQDVSAVLDSLRAGGAVILDGFLAEDAVEAVINGILDILREQ